MQTFGEKLAIALQHHQAGRLEAAEELYRQILVAHPEEPNALHLLGVVAHQVGQHKAAVDYIERAIRLNGNAAPFHGDLGQAYRAWGKLPKAVACFRRASELDPQNAGMHYDLGLALKQAGNTLGLPATRRPAGICGSTLTKET